LENLIVKDDQPIPLEDIDDAAIQAKLAEIEQLMHGLSTKIYEAAAAEMAEQDSEGESDDGVVEADFEVVDSDEENEDS
jgi:molecular chaperone DnaK